MEWIKADIEVPATDDYVLCCCRAKNRNLNIVKGYYADGRWCCGMNSNVTHWMPLPEPPKEADND